MPSLAEEQHELNVDSRVQRAARPHPRLSERWLAFDWRDVLPWRIDEFIVEDATYAEVAPFMKENYERFFGDQPFLKEGMTESKRRFWEEMDIFAFRHQDKLVGYWAGHPSDWSTYYCRTIGILPEYRESRLASEVSKNITIALANTDIARLEVDISVANVAMQRLLQRLGFLVTSTLTSERWGHVLRMTKFLREDAASVFERQFVSVPRFGKEQPKKRGG